MLNLKKAAKVNMVSLKSAQEAPDFVTSSITQILSFLRVNPDSGLTLAEIDLRRQEYGFNEVQEKRKKPVLAFIKKFWGLSAWMLELIMILSAVLGKYADLVVVGVKGGFCQLNHGKAAPLHRMVAGD